MISKITTIRQVVYEGLKFTSFLASSSFENDNPAKVGGENTANSFNAV